MFIKDLDITTPPGSDDFSENDNLSKADDYIVEIKNALKDTFPNFSADGAGQPITYLFTDLYGMYNFLTANATELIYKGTTQGTMKNVLAVTKDKVVYARPPRALFFSVLWFRLTQAQLDSFYPDTYIQLNGNNDVLISGKTINRLLGPAFNTLAVPDLRNRYLRGSTSSRTPFDESLKFDTESVKSYIKVEDLKNPTLGEHTHHAGFVGQSRTAGPVTSAIWDSAGTNEISLSTSPDSSLATAGHTHTFVDVDTILTGFTFTKDAAKEQKIRPATYNLYPYMRIN